MMQWQKLGVVYTPPGDVEWMHSHAMLPCPLDMGDGRLRVYVSFRDSKGVGRAGFVDVDAQDPKRVLRVSDRPCLDIGTPGSFDDNGVVSLAVVRLPDGRLLMYYVGFELCTHIRYRLLTGAAISDDGGDTFVRVKPTAILERSPAEQHFRCGPFVLPENGKYRMWYVAGSEWMMLGDKPMPIYDMRYLESDNGIDWPYEGKVIMQFAKDEHGFGRPWITHEDGKYKMYYSIRKISLQSYRLGYAESDNGRDWVRRDDQLNLDVSASGWDSEAIMYSAVMHCGDKTFLFYNGNDFGGSGFGVARLEQR